MNRITLLLIFFSGYMYGQCPPLNNSGWDTDSKDAPSPPGSKTYSYGYADIGGTGEIRNAVAGSIYQLFYQGNCPEQGELYFVIREGRTGPVVGTGVLPVSFMHQKTLVILWIYIETILVQLVVAMAVIGMF